MILTTEGNDGDYDITLATLTNIKKGAYAGRETVPAFQENGDKIKTFVIRSTETLLHQNKRWAVRSYQWLPIRVVARHRPDFEVEAPSLQVCMDMLKLREIVEGAGFYRETFVLIEYAEALDACTIPQAPPDWIYSTGYSTWYPAPAVLTADEWQRDWA